MVKSRSRTFDKSVYSILTDFTKDARIIEADGLGPKVLELTDGSYLKLFRSKHWLSSAFFFPYSKRFIKNSEKLTALNILHPQIIQSYRFTNGDTAVQYLPLPGNSLRSVLMQLDNRLAEREQLVKKTGAFFASLHNKGIYFRSLHLGNVILLPNQELGLIDLADMRFLKSPLNLPRRRRNLKHMQRHPQDKQWLFCEQKKAFWLGYISVSNYE